MANMPKKVAVIGAGPAGLMAAEHIALHGFSVSVFDAMPSAARKFLMAGVGGMNITHSEAEEDFLSRYDQPRIRELVATFNSADLRQWIHDLGIETFVGSSGRVFPKEMKAAPLLRRWLQRLRQQNVQFFMRHQWQGFAENGALIFTTPQEKFNTHFDAVVLALGGASWPKLGSTGTWVEYLQTANIPINPFIASNCGFTCPFSAKLRSHAGSAIKSARFSVANQSVLGEAMLTAYGIEGNAIYTLGANIRHAIKTQGKALLSIDLLPQIEQDALAERFADAKASLSTGQLLRKKTKLSAAAIALFFEAYQTEKERLRDAQFLAKALKNVPLELLSSQPIDEAISSAGGIDFSALTSDLMLNNIAGVFCAGEMLDWDAPTGGYLLTACFASGLQAGKGVVNYLQATEK